MCIVPACPHSATAEVLRDRPRKNSKNLGVRIFACEKHMRDADLNVRLGGPQWQRLLLERPKEEK
jgi:hypothetical protein